MKKKYILAALSLGLSVSAKVIAQVPSYVPSNGLVGWWPFTGNANDESGNGNNGTVNGATLTTDRFGNPNQAYSFDGSDWISTLPENNNYSTGISISAWIDVTGQNNFNSAQFFVSKEWDQLNGHYAIGWYNNSIFGDVNNTTSGGITAIQTIPFGGYTHVIYTFDGVEQKLYVNGILNNTNSYNNLLSSVSDSILFGRHEDNGSTSYFTVGKIDDIGIWNRALTLSEINSLFQGCNLNPTISPATASVSSGANALFTTQSVSGATYQWQNNPLNNGWQNVPSNATYGGGTTNTLSINNLQISNHQQPFRVIVTNGSCIYTSTVAHIELTDTCINTINDTIFTTVTDTLIINTTLSLAPPNDQNTIKIYPNPAIDHITIDNGNYSAMAGYSLKITNNAGQQVFQSPINQAQFYVDLSSWTGNGLYFVHLIDSQNNTVTIRKIVLQ